MDKLARLIRNVDVGEWAVGPTRAVARVGQGIRHQDVTVRRIGDEYVLKTTVLGRRKVTRDDEQWRDLARLAWQRNAEQEIVTFTFDRRDRLLGVIRHPVEHLDAEELRLYVQALARECDRFEYLLTGRDRF